MFLFQIKKQYLPHQKRHAVTEKAEGIHTKRI